MGGGGGGRNFVGDQFRIGGGGPDHNLYGEDQNKKKQQVSRSEQLNFFRKKKWRAKKIQKRKGLHGLVSRWTQTKKKMKG